MEVKILLSQNVIPSQRSLGGSLPYVFTEKGIAMLSSVLTSKRAVYVNIQIMRTFIKLREFMLSHKDLAHKIEQLEGKLGRHDKDIQLIFESIKRLMTSNPNPKPNDDYMRTKIGFVVD